MPSHGKISYLESRYMCEITPAKLADYLRKHVINTSDPPIVTEDLLKAVAIEAIPPRVYRIWLSVCPDASAIAAGLRQMHSVFCRVAAVKEFRRRFRTEQVTEVWEALSGASGIGELMSTWSVNEVKAFCRAIHRSGTTLICQKERQLLVDELVNYLLPQADATSDVKNPDKRPLQTDYLRMVYACSPATIKQWKDQARQPELDIKALIRIKPLLCKQWCLDRVHHGDSKIDESLPLLTSAMPLPADDDPSVTQSMMFSIEVLEAMLANDRFPVDDDVLQQIIITTTRKLARRKVRIAGASLSQDNGSVARTRASKAFTIWAFEIMSRALQQQNAKGSASKIRGALFIGDLAVIWRREGDVIAPDATSLLRAVGVPAYEGMRWLSGIIREAPCKQRWPLLKWLLKHAQGWNFDLDAPGASSSKLPDIDLTLFSLLSAARANDLLDSLLRLDMGDKISGPMHGAVDGADLNMYLLRLSINEDANLRKEVAPEHILRCRKKAETNREASVRAFWVEAAFRLAATSQSLETFGDTLLWAQRFKGDSLTIHTAYGINVMSSEGVVNCLVGMPKSQDGHTDSAVLAQQVHKANEILLSILHTAIACQKEPSFHAVTWQRTLQRLFCDVLEARIRRSNFLVGRQSWSNTDVYTNIWQDTLRTLIKAESICLAEENALLGLHDPAGLTLPLFVKDGAAKTATLRFVDQLALQRDALWRTYRMNLKAATLELRKPWPQGLPVQSLLGYTYKGEITDDDLPFISERLRQVVFPDPKLVLETLPQDEEARSAIGLYLEAYKDALREYVNQASSKKTARLSEAWQYALTHLSDRMTSLEARLLWDQVFREAQVPVPNSWLELPQAVLPRLPEVEPDEKNVSEWNPLTAPHQPKSIKRVLEPVILDCMIVYDSNWFGGSNASKSFVVPEVEVPAYDVDTFWSLYNQPRIPSYASEAFIAAGLLYIDSRTKSDSSLLTKPFPAGDDHRFPAVFLDEGFLAQPALDTNPKGTWARTVLERFTPDIPATLLARVVTPLMRELKEKPETLPLTAFDLLKMLVYSDKPELAFEMIVGVIVGMRNESSWHRQLMQAGIFKRLPAQQVKSLAGTLANKLLDKLDEQARRHAVWKADGNSKEEHASAPPTSLVKITTVKMLAELLENTTFDESFSVDTLRLLLTKFTHLDVRAAVVSTLVRILSKTTLESSRNEVLAILEQHVVHVAASMNERNPMTKEDWLHAERTGQIPAVGVERPLLLLLTATSRSIPAEVLRSTFYRRIVLPLIEQSTENNARWTRLFLARHHALHLLRDITPIPAHPMLPTNILHQSGEVTAAMTGLVPPQTFEQYSKYVLAVLDQPQDLLEFNARLRMIKDAEGAEARKHWLSQWCGYTATVLHDYTVLDVPKMLRTAEWSAVPGTLQLDHAHTHERNVIDALLRRYDTCVGYWSTQRVRYELRPADRREAAKKWEVHLKPMLEYMVRRVDETRTAAWQQDPQRVPSVLPSTFPIRMRLLPHPGDGVEDSKFKQTARAHAFVDAVTELLGKLADQRTYHADYKLLKEHVKSWTNERTVVNIVLRIGSFEVPSEGLASTVQLLRAELVRHVIEGFKKPDPGTAALREMFEGWQGSSDEEMRREGIAGMRHVQGYWV